MKRLSRQKKKKGDGGVEQEKSSTIILSPVKSITRGGFLIMFDYSSYVYWNYGNGCDGFQLVSTSVLEQSELDIYQTGGNSH